MTYEAMTNEDRAKQVGIALQAFATATGLKESEDGAETIAGDMIAGILHWVVSREHGGGYAGALMAARKGIGHFISEAYAEKDYDGDLVGPDAFVTVYIVCDGDEWRTASGETTPSMPSSFGGDEE